MARSCGYNAYGQYVCRDSTWGNWARWLVLALIILGAFFIFFLFSYVYESSNPVQAAYSPVPGASQRVDGEEWVINRTVGLAGRLGGHQQAMLLLSTTMPRPITHRKPKTTNHTTTTRTTRLPRLRHTALRMTTMVAARTTWSFSNPRTPISHRKIRRQEDTSCCAIRRH